MNLNLSAHLQDWLARPVAAEAEPIRLTQRRVYVLPTAGGLLLCFTLTLMLLGCINYNLGLGYVLTFLLTGVAAVGLLQTFRNLSRLEISAGRVDPVFAGEVAQFTLSMRNPARQARYSIGVGVAGTFGLRAPPAAATRWCDIPAGATVFAAIPLDAPDRGRLQLPRLRVFTTYPLGLFQAWANIRVDMTCVVYPAPEQGEVPPPVQMDALGAATGRGTGHDDFAGLRRYQPGDSARHVAWKALARGQELLTKQFTGQGGGELWLRWNDLPAALRTEARLSRMTRWVLDAGREGVAFGLDIPGAREAPAAGQAHEHRCLTALALFGKPR